jgi:hypothetical protein
MSGVIKKLGRLKGRGADELRVRGAQALAAAAERAGLSSLSRLPSDEAFLRTLGAAGGKFNSADAWLEHFRTRSAPRFFKGFDDESAIREALRARFADEGAAVVAHAERILAGRFDLLGLEDLDFGSPVDWHVEPLSRVRAPLAHWSRIDFLDPKVSGDKKFIWELSRHQFFQTLGRAYWRTGDERYAEGFARYADAWMDANPPKLGVNWASSLEVAFRSISWLWALHFFKRSPHLTPALFLRLSKFLYLNARHLETYLSTYFSPNTHLTGEALGLFYISATLPELRDSARRRERGRSVLLAELDRHVRPDGVYFEQTTYYHRYTTDFYTHFALLSRADAGGRAEVESREARLSSKLTSLLDHMMHLTLPDGATPFVGDDDGGRLVMLDERPAADFRAALSNGAALFGRADYKHVAGRAAEETLWLVGPAGLEAFDALDARPPEETSRAFEEGGYYVMRDGWSDDSDYMLLDCGPHGAEGIGCGHAHADALSFVLAARGRTLLVDPGTYTYTGSREERERFRSTRAHNALTVDGESSSEPGEGAFRWSRVARSKARRWVAAKGFDLFEGEHDGFLRLDPPVEYARSVLFLKGDYWVLRDRVAPRRIDPDGGGRHLYETRFHFAPGAETTIEERGGAFVLCARDAGGAALEILSPRADGAWSEGDGWVSRCYGARERAAVCTRSLKTETFSDSFAFIRPQDARAHAYLKELNADGGRAFQLSSGGRRDVLIVRTNEVGREVRASGFASDFDWAWLRFSEATGALDEFVVVGGMGLTLNGRQVVGSDGGRIGHLASRLDRGGRRVVESDGLSLFRAPAASDPFAVVLGGGDELEGSLTYVRD